MCIYLDGAREWHPGQGMWGLLNHLWGWLRAAAAAEFDAADALYHPVGGMIHYTPGAPTIVLRQPVDGSRAVRRIWVTPRSGTRIDVSIGGSPGDHAAVLVNLSTARPLGAGQTLGELYGTMAIHPGSVCGPFRALLNHSWPKLETTLAALAVAAARNPVDADLYLLISVPHIAGGASTILAGRLDAASSAQLRALAIERGPGASIGLSDLSGDPSPPSSAACAAIRTPSAPVSPCLGAADRLKATSTGSR
ncbi:hypothetical protein ACQP06_13975 [Nocardia sp. CA-136227]|uniref:hypothetical protein n=1 Tax=Nocardia sp. CA-136227 TaxID=3239979 RepID=UPI003D956FF9